MSIEHIVNSAVSQTSACDHGFHHCTASVSATMAASVIVAAAESITPVCSSIIIY